MIDRYKDRIDAASYSELYQLARGILMDLDALEFGAVMSESAIARTIHEEVAHNFEVYLPDKV